MSEITLQHHRTVWHFVPGLALSAVVTGVALWGGSIPAVAGAGFSALTLAILIGMVVGNTVYPHSWKSCDGGIIFAKQHLLRLGIILTVSASPFRRLRMWASAGSPSTS